MFLQRSGTSRDGNACSRASQRPGTVGNYLFRNGTESPMSRCSGQLERLEPLQQKGLRDALPTKRTCIKWTNGTPRPNTTSPPTLRPTPARTVWRIAIHSIDLEMFNVSRSYAPDAWLQPVPQLTKGGKALDAQSTIRIEKSRFSVSTINNELLPELLSWSALMDSPLPSLALDPIPKYAAKSRKCESLESDRERQPSLKFPLSSILDPTTLEVGFDASCFDGLDDLLISSPLDAYAELCWSDGVVAHSRSRSEPITFAKYSPYPRNAAGHSRRRQMRSALVTRDASSDESDTDSDDECRTYRDEDTERLMCGSGDMSGQVLGGFPSYDDEKSLYYNDGHGVSSFMVFESRFSNPQESVGCFPIPVSPPKSARRRFASFCANRLPFVRSSTP